MTMAQMKMMSIEAPVCRTPCPCRAVLALNHLACVICSSRLADDTFAVSPSSHEPPAAISESFVQSPSLALSALASDIGSDSGSDFPPQREAQAATSSAKPVSLNFDTSSEEEGHNGGDSSCGEEADQFYVDVDEDARVTVFTEVVAEPAVLPPPLQQQHVSPSVEPRAHAVPIRRASAVPSASIVPSPSPPLPDSFTRSPSVFTRTSSQGACCIDEEAAVPAAAAPVAKLAVLPPAPRVTKRSKKCVLCWRVRIACAHQLCWCTGL
jgi:hypothetical protein